MRTIGRPLEAKHRAFRYRSLRQFAKWLAAEGEVDADPMAYMYAPRVTEEPVPILTPDDLKALLSTCRVAPC